MVVELSVLASQLQMASGFGSVLTVWFLELSLLWGSCKPERLIR